MSTQTVIFIQDLAVIMLVAGFITMLCHRLKQPLVLGYIIAGIIIGPYTPPFSFINDENTIAILAELGVIFLMFSLGLEFNLRKLSKVGLVAIITAIIEIVIMTSLGYGCARLLGWQQIDAVFMGAMLAISSTTIIIKALDELNLKGKKFAHLIFGILIVEDIFAIAILALLSSIASTGSWQAGDVIITLIRLCSFLVVSLVVGILIVPRLLSYISKFNSQEILLIFALATCFGFCLLAIKLGYSVALGAFISGAILAETRHLVKIEALVLPLRDMFSAIFFVSVGLLFDPTVLFQYGLPILAITLVIIIGKIITCGGGMLLTGQRGKIALQVGLGMAQIGEFSFIIAALGTSLNVTSAFLYPIAVVVSAITTLTTPYLIRYTKTVHAGLASHMPVKLAKGYDAYCTGLNKLHKVETSATNRTPLFRWTIQVIINLFIIIAIFFSCAYLSQTSWVLNLLKLTNQHLYKAIIWTTAMLLSLPFIIAAYRKMKAVSLWLAEASFNHHDHRPFIKLISQLISELIPIIIIISMLLFICALSISILPPLELLIGIFFIITIVAALVYRWFIRLYHQLKTLFIENLKKDKI